MSKLAEFRRIADFDRSAFEPVLLDGEPQEGNWWRNISYDEATGQGSYLMIMDPGARSNPHLHEGAEEFYVVEGDLEEFDGTVYRAGDFVSLAAGSAHESVSRGGCKLVVTHRGPVRDLDARQWAAAR